MISSIIIIYINSMLLLDLHITDYLTLLLYDVSEYYI